MKTWFLAALVVAVIFLLWRGTREGFENPKAPIDLPNPGGQRGTYKGYDVAETTRIWNLLNSEDKAAITDYNQRQPQASYMGPDARASVVVSDFYQSKYSPTTPVAPDVVDAYVETNKSPFGQESWPEPMVAALKRLLKAYFIAPASGATNNSDYERVLASLGQSSAYSTPGGPTGGVQGSSSTGSTGGTSTPPSGPMGGVQGGVAPAGPTGSTGGTTTGGSTGPPGSALTSSGNTPGNTTGGSSITGSTPTSGGMGLFSLWGPTAAGRGESSSSSVDGADSSKSLPYPVLLGGMGGRTDKTRVEGVGLTAPSSSWQLSMSGLLPDAKSLGATEDSKYLPFSRAPGDLEKIPDPWRVSQTYTTSSYSSKTDPVPFLADFSAFQK